MAKQTSDATFENDVMKSKGAVLVDFWAPWCGPCRMLGPIIEKVAEKAGDNAKVYKLNVDENPMIARRYGITSIPTLLFFKNGENFRRQDVPADNCQV